MTTIIPFLPSNIRAPRFVAQFDGDDHNVIITWNISAQRYYVNVYDSTGVWIITIPLIQTPPTRKIESLIYDRARNIVVATMSSPTEWPVPLSPAGIVTKPGTIVDYTLENFTPTTYNGKQRSMQLDNVTFSYPVTQDPGPIQIYGTVSRILNMVSGVFKTSTLIYRNGAFEVTP
jgi:hypothetical protein